MEDDVIKTKWCCEACTYNNWPASKRCIICRTAKPLQFIEEGAQSSLPYNDSINSDNDESISENATNTKPYHLSRIVKKSESRESISLERELGKWSCSACTYYNWPRSLKCTQCHTLRPSNIDQTSLTSARATNSPETAKAASPVLDQLDHPPNKWACPACTYENWAVTNKCVMCATIKTTENSQICTESTELQRGCLIEDIESCSLADASSRSICCKKSDLASNHTSRFRDLNKNWLNACKGVLDGDINNIEMYLNMGGDPKRQLTTDDVQILGRPSAFTAGHTLIHLALRFHQKEILTYLLRAAESVTDAASRKKPLFTFGPELAAEILRHASASLRKRKGEFGCYYFASITGFALPTEIDEFSEELRNQIFDDILDRNAQKELEDMEPVINWSSELVDQLGSRLYPLWNRTAGDCLLDSVLQASCGLMDNDNMIRFTLSDSLNDGSSMFYHRWKISETMQANLLNFTFNERQWQDNWTAVLSLASQPGASLEQIHIFVLSHIFRRPIIVYGIKYIKSLRGEKLGYAGFQGVYLPLLWEPSFCWRSPISLGYTRGHFCALVPVHPDDQLESSVCSKGAAQENFTNEDDGAVVYLPLVDYKGQILSVHFLLPSEMGREESLLRSYLDCCSTCSSNMLVARQTCPRPTHLINQLLNKWLHHYRRLGQVLYQKNNQRARGYVIDENQERGDIKNEFEGASSEEETDDELL